MSDNDKPAADDSAEKAYAAAVSASEKAPAIEAEPVENSPAEDIKSDSDSDAVPAPAEAPAATKASPAPKVKPRKARTSAKKKVAVPAKVVTKPLTPAKAAAAKKKPAIAKTAKPKSVAAAKTATSAKSMTSSSPKETQMTTKKTDEGIEKVISEAQEKAKEAFDKTSAMFGEYGEFAKGNVEAFVESGKILATGLKEMGSELVTEGKTGFETITSDVKELASVKSPDDFVKLQSEIMRRNIDAAVSYGSKSSEAMLKLANEAFAPLSSRFSMAVSKFREAA